MSKLKNVSLNNMLTVLFVLTALSWSVSTAEAKKKRSTIVGPVAMLQGSWTGYGVVQGQKARCRVTIRNRSVSAHCANASGAVRSNGRLRGVSRPYTRWRSTDGQYSGVSHFSSVSRRSHVMRVNVDGQGSGSLRMRKR